MARYLQRIQRILVFSNKKQQEKKQGESLLQYFLPTLEFKIINSIIPTDQPIFVLPSARRTINYRLRYNIC